MGLFLVLFWCAAIALCVLQHASLLGGLSSLLDRKKFPFSPLREPRKALIRPVIFGTETSFQGAIEKNSLVHGNSRESCRHPGTGRGATSSGADLALPEGPLDLMNSTPQQAYYRGSVGKDGPNGRARWRRDLAWFPRTGIAG
jgi:hypothetical protein